MRNLLMISLAAVGLFSCSNPSSVLGLPPSGTAGEKISDNGVEVFDPSVDILFVIDNSGSMEHHQSDLSNNVNRFIQSFVKKSGLDFHIGVVTTDMGDDPFGTKGPCCGVLTGQPRFIERTTPNFASALSQNMIVGIDGSSNEQSFAPVIAALSEPNLSENNVGFYRPKAHLAVIFMTDAEDHSDTTVDGFMKFLIALKGDTAKVSVYGAIVPSTATNCQRDEPGVVPQRIESLLGKVSNAGNNVMSLCSPDFGDRLASLGDDLLRRVGSLIYLNRRPVAGTIRVNFGSQSIPADPLVGFRYDSFRNAIILGEKIVWSNQPAGAKVQVSYEAAAE